MRWTDRRDGGRGGEAALDDTEDATTRSLAAALRRALELGRDVGTSSAAVLGSGLDEATRIAIGQRVRRALTTTTGPPEVGALVDALEPGGGQRSVTRRLGGQTALRVARRTRFARRLAGRTPVGLAVQYGPVVARAVVAGRRSVDATAAHLVARARERGVEPDPDRLARVVAQLLTGLPPDPNGPVDHARLASQWLTQLGWRLAPFDLGAKRDQRRLGDTVAAIADFDVHTLAEP